jgi:MinD superfamily P-loop ATPase
MKFAILSGKGGTGKTLVATNLAAAVKPSQYVDLDVEEPNGFVFLKPRFRESLPVTVPVPVLEEEKCSGCGLCARACQFNALAIVKGKVLFFPELCHHCGACALACPEEALREGQRTVGDLSISREGDFLQGRLRVGEPVAVPVIKALQKRVAGSGPVFLDCPPGAACAVVQAVEGADYCLLVTEPTPFGLHDLGSAVRLMEKLALPFGVLVNKGEQTAGPLHRFCRERGIKILAEIPFSLEVARRYSRGELLVEAGEDWRTLFQTLFARLREEAGL